MKIILNNLIKVSSNQIYAGMHWRGRHKLKNDYLFLTNSFKDLEAIEGKVDLDFKFYFKKNALDSSNCSYLAKVIEDCLVHHKVLKGDTIKYVGKVSMESFKTVDNDYCIITTN